MTIKQWPYARASQPVKRVRERLFEPLVNMRDPDSILGEPDGTCASCGFIEHRPRCRAALQEYAALPVAPETVAPSDAPRMGWEIRDELHGRPRYRRETPDGEMRVFLSHHGASTWMINGDPTAVRACCEFFATRDDAMLRAEQLAGLAPAEAAGAVRPGWYCNHEFNGHPHWEHERITPACGGAIYWNSDFKGWRYNSDPTIGRVFADVADAMRHAEQLAKAAR